MKGRKQSPLKGPPLRNPGQSLDDKLDDLFMDRVLFPLMLAFMFAFVAGFEWWSYVTARKPHPWFFTTVAVIAVCFAAGRIALAIPRINSIRLARNGERVVGQHLERLRELGYRVFHDVREKTFNIDHVLVGPAGVFTVETKTLSKPIGRDAEVSFDGKQLLVNGRELERNPLIQARAQVSWLRELLQESTGRKLPVRAVILFPGWMIRNAPGATRDLWVLSPKALGEFLSNEKAKMTADDVSLASFHLSRFLRSIAAA